MESLTNPQADLNFVKESSQVRHAMVPPGSFPILIYRRHCSCGHLRCQCPKGDRCLCCQPLQYEADRACLHTQADIFQEN